MFVSFLYNINTRTSISPQQCASSLECPSSSFCLTPTTGTTGLRADRSTPTRGERWGSERKEYGRQKWLPKEGRPPKSYVFYARRFFQPVKRSSVFLFGHEFVWPSVKTKRFETLLVLEWHMYKRLFLLVIRVSCTSQNKRQDSTSC